MDAPGSDSTVCLTVLGRERPGIVAAITGALYDQDCNIKDSTMTVLGGEFTMTLIVDLPPGQPATVLEQALSGAQRRYELGVYIRRLGPDEVRYAPAPGAQRWAITIYGGDRKGLVHHVSSLLARKGISIVELKTRVLGGLGGAGIISLRVVAPPEIEKGAVRAQLQEVAARFGVEVSIG